jgi:hypothetical protein
MDYKSEGLIGAGMQAWDLMRNEKLPMADYRLTATDDTECAPDYAFRKISYLDSKKYCNCFK